MCVAYFLEVGLLLVLVPWTASWERNYFVASLPLVQDVLRNNFVRGGVSGLGVVNLVVGFDDLASLLSARRGLGPIAPSSPPPISSLVNEE